jgi:hypothetical protein
MSIALRLLVNIGCLGLLSLFGAWVDQATGVGPLISPLPAANRIVYRLALMVIGTSITTLVYWLIAGHLPPLS